MSRHHIRKREHSAGVTWYATVELSRDPMTGKRRQKHVSAPTRKACEAKIAQLIERDDRGEAMAASKLTVAQYLDQWARAIEPTVKISTITGYRHKMNAHIVPLIGHIQIGRLAPLHVQGVIAKLLDRGLSPTTVHHSYTILSTALRQAVKWGVVERNVCLAVDPPRKARPDLKTWTRDEAARVLAAAEGRELEALWRLALTTGMRRGELLGLRWIDVDLQRGVLAIRHTLVQGASSALVSSAPKSASGQRSIVIGPDDIECLTRHRDRQRLARTPNPAGLVFISPNGNPVHQHVLAKQFERLIEAAGVPRIRFHDTRHTSATLLMEAGVHAKIVAERLGHSSIAITLDRYSHVAESIQQVAALMLNDHLKASS
jgi:integrase